MVSRGERAISKAEIERLQKAQKKCTDGGIRNKLTIGSRNKSRSYHPAINHPAPFASILADQKNVSQTQGAALFTRVVIGLLLLKGEKASKI